MLYRIYYIKNTDMHLFPYYLIEYTSIAQWESRGTSQKNNFFKKCSITSVTLWSIKRKKPKFKIP